MLNNIKPKNVLINKIQNYAPSAYSSAPGYERRLGIYSDDAECENTGFQNVCIHIQAGLNGLEALYYEIFKMISAIQISFNNYYSVFVFCYGATDKSIKEIRYFKCLNQDVYNFRKRSAEIEEFISKQERELNSIIEKLSPTGSNKNIYGGLVGFENNDLLIVIGEDQELQISCKFQRKFDRNTKKKAIYVQISDENVNWLTGDKLILNFIELN